MLLKTNKTHIVQQWNTCVNRFSFTSLILFCAVILFIAKQFMVVSNKKSTLFCFFFRLYFISVFFRFFFRFFFCRRIEKMRWFSHTHNDIPRRKLILLRMLLLFCSFAFRASFAISVHSKWGYDEDKCDSIFFWLTDMRNHLGVRKSKHINWRTNKRRIAKERQSVSIFFVWTNFILQYKHLPRNVFRVVKINRNKRMNFSVRFAVRIGAWWLQPKQ